MIDPLSVWINKGSNLGICSVWLSGASIVSSPYLSAGNRAIQPLYAMCIVLNISNTIVLTNLSTIGI